MEFAASEGKYFYAPTLLFLLSVVNCASILASDIKVLGDHFISVIMSLSKIFCKEKQIKILLN